MQNTDRTNTPTSLEAQAQSIGTGNAPAPDPSTSFATLEVPNMADPTNTLDLEGPMVKRRRFDSNLLHGFMSFHIGNTQGIPHINHTPSDLTTGTSFFGLADSSRISARKERITSPLPIVPQSEDSNDSLSPERTASDSTDRPSQAPKPSVPAKMKVKKTYSEPRLLSQSPALSEEAEAHEPNLDKPEPFASIEKLRGPAVSSPKSRQSESEVFKVRTGKSSPQSQTLLSSSSSLSNPNRKASIVRDITSQDLEIDADESDDVSHSMLIGSSAPSSASSLSVDWCVQRLEALKESEMSLQKKLESVQNESKHIQAILERLVGPRQTFIEHIINLCERLRLKSPYARLLLTLPTSAVQFLHHSLGQSTLLDVQFAIIRMILLHTSSRIPVLEHAYSSDNISLSKQLGMVLEEGEYIDEALIEADFAQMSSMSSSLNAMMDTQHSVTNKDGKVLKSHENEHIAKTRDGRARDPITMAIIHIDRFLCIDNDSLNKPHSIQVRDLRTLYFILANCNIEEMELIRSATLPVFESIHRQAFSNVEVAPRDIWNITSMRLTLPHVAHQTLGIYNLRQMKTKLSAQTAHIGTWDVLRDISRCVGWLCNSVVAPLLDDDDEGFEASMQPYRIILAHIRSLRIGKVASESQSLDES